MQYRSLIVAFVLGMVAPGLAAAAEPVTVTVANGRSYTGQIDERSNEQRLVLRFEGANITLRRAFEWSTLVKIEARGESFSPPEIRAAAAQRYNARATPPRVTSFKMGPRPAAQVTPSVAAPVKSTESLARTAVRSLAIDAYVTNWDAGVEPDGFVVYVRPLDARGQLAPVNGTLYLEWISPRQRRTIDIPREPLGQASGAAHGRRTYTAPHAIERLGQWTTGIAATDFGPAGFEFRAPFPAVHPEFDSSVGNWGLVRARLAAPGEGVFEAAVDGVAVRSYSPVRSLLQSSGGSRFLSHEQTDRR